MLTKSPNPKPVLKGILALASTLSIIWHPGLLLSQSPGAPPLPARPKIYSRRTVKPLIKALEANDNKRLALNKSGLHAWNVWRDVNQPYKVKVIQVNNARETSAPRWLTWCTTDDLAEIKSNANPSFCSGLGKKDDDTDDAPDLRNDITKGFRGRSKAQFASTAHSQSSMINSNSILQSNAVLESTHFNAAAVRGLLKLMRDFCESGTKLGDFGDCVKKAPKPEKVPLLLRFRPISAQWNELLKRALPQTAIVIKASWMLIDIEPNQPASYFKFFGPWMGPKSLIGQENLISLAGRPAESFWTPQDSFLKVPLPARGPACPSANEADVFPLPSQPGEIPLSSFFHFQYCADPKTFGPVTVLKGNYVVLRSLHVMTNSNPSGDWTWSTYYWHKPSCDFDALAPISPESRRGILLKARPNGMDGWQANYHMDLMYTHREKIIPEKEWKDEINKLIGKKDPTGKPIDAQSFCKIDPKDFHAGVFNPYVEARFDCGVFSTCIGCHSHAESGRQIGKGLTPEEERLRRDDKLKDTHIFTHFLWSLARSFTSP